MRQMTQRPKQNLVNDPIVERLVGAEILEKLRAGVRLARACTTLITLVLLSACGGNDGTFRYRLAFSVSVNGAVKSGSSIISVHYRGGQPGWESGVTTYTTVKGVAPVIDLGQNGTLVAAMAYD